MNRLLKMNHMVHLHWRWQYDEWRCWLYPWFHYIYSYLWPL